MEFKKDITPYQDILTPDACAFVDILIQKFQPKIESVLNKRIIVQT